MKEIRVGCLGLGNVMQAFIRHYNEIADKIAQDFGFRLRVVAYCDTKKCVYDQDLDILDALRRKEHEDTESNNGDTLQEFGSVIEKNNIDILVDALPSSKKDDGPTFPLLCEALKKNIAVIFVNKAPLVFKGAELIDLVKTYKTRIGISSTTAGCLPTSSIIMNDLVASEITGVRGILNGTSNYVLDLMMFEKLSCEQAVQKAVELGIAEPDFLFDLDGTDTGYKMIILGLVITGQCVRPQDIPRTGILELTQEYMQSVIVQDKVVRLIGQLSVDSNKPRISVRPEVIDSKDPLFPVRGTGKGVLFRTKYMGDLHVIGGSSGRKNIAATMIKDIINVSKE